MHLNMEMHRNMSKLCFKEIFLAEIYKVVWMQKT